MSTGAHDSREKAAIRYVAIGDSFTEGVGDELPDGSVRGWADLVALGLAQAAGEPIQYANFAIRGRLLARIIEEQLEPALALGPTLVTFNGGGNDMLRPGTNMPWIIRETARAVSRMQASGAEVLLLMGPNPTEWLPAGNSVQFKGEALVAAATKLARQMGVNVCDNWNDELLPHRQYWSHDRLHLGPVGHARVAANVLRALGKPVPADWVLEAPQVPAPTRLENVNHTRKHVLPWIGRRLTGRSSGDGRDPKYSDWVWVDPPA